MTPLTRDVVWATITFAAYIAGLGTAVKYVLRQRLTVVFRHKVVPAPKATVAVTRDRMPTLTGLQIDRAVSELARKCRSSSEKPL